MENKYLASVLNYENPKEAPILNKEVPDNQRNLLLSPTVRIGLERECKIEDFQKMESIGKGGFGEVQKVLHKKTRKLYCIKKVHKEQIIHQNLTNQMNREIEIMYALNHPHCLRLKNHFEDNEYFYLLMPLASKGHLYRALKQQRHFDERTTAQYLRETISALKYLHSFNPPIIHRDLKPENLLLNESNRILLADFGWSNFNEDEAEKRKTFCGTPEYIAPEMLKKEGHDHRVDIWSIGVLMFELLAGHSPFAAKTNIELYQNIRNLKIKWPSTMNPLAKNLVSKILKIVPAERLTFDQILDHEWFRRTPEITPLLSNEYHNDRDLIMFHSISLITPEITSKINTILGLTDSPSAPPQQMSEQNNITEQEERRKSIIHELKEKNKANSSQDSLVIDVQKEENIRLQYNNKKQSQEIDYLRSKLSNSETDIKALKGEIIKLKESNPIALQEKIKQQNEKIEELRVGEKYRLEALSEIEEKNKKIRDLNTTIQIMEGENNQKDKEFESFKNQIKELNKQIEGKEMIIDQLNKKNSILDQEKENAFLDYQKKIEMLNIKISSSSDGSESSSNSSKVIMLLNESVDEFKSIFKKKMDIFIENFTHFKEEYTKRDEKLTMLIKDKGSELESSVQKSSDKLANDIQRVLNNSNKGATTSKDQQTEWLKKQISELTPYKNKVLEYERKIQEFQHKLAYYEELKIINETIAKENNKGCALSTARTKEVFNNYKFLKEYVKSFFNSIENLIHNDEDKKNKTKIILDKLEVDVNHI